MDENNLGDLAALSLDKLERLELALMARIAEQEDRERRRLAKRVLQLANEHGVSLKELIDDNILDDVAVRKSRVAKEPGKPRAKPKAKYRHPSTNEEWTGRGRPPRWMTEWVAKGGNIDDLLIVKGEPE